MKTWISIPLITTFDKNDKYVQEFLKKQKPVLEAKIKKLIREELEMYISPFSIEGDEPSYTVHVGALPIEDQFVADVADGKVDVVDEAPKFYGNTNAVGAIMAICDEIAAEQDKNAPRPIEITENEKNLMLAIRDSEYNSGSPDKSDPVWVDCLWGFEGKKKFGGVMASLTKKNLAQTDGECAWLTQVGLDRIKDEPHICTIDRARQGQGYVSSQEKPLNEEAK